MSDLPRDLRVKAGMIMMCERIPFGSDAALMEMAANEIERLQKRCSELEGLIVKLPQGLTYPYTDMVYLSDVERALDVSGVRYE